METIYLVQNTSDDEGYFLLGAFLDRDKAIDTARAVDADCLDNVDDEASVEVVAVKIGMFGSGCTIFRIFFKKEYMDDDCEEYKWVILNEKFLGKNMTTDTLATREDTVTITRAEYERLLTLTKPQSIETAPRDGSYIILFEFDGSVDTGIWDADTNRWFNGWHYMLPTHWLPLTSIPKRKPLDDKNG